MSNVASVILDTIPISQFNRGMAGKIFAEVKEKGARVVMKNNCAECVLLAPNEYIRLIDLAEDAKLAAVAAKRMESFDLKNTVTADEVYKKYGVDEIDTSDFDEVEFE